MEKENSVAFRRRIVTDQGCGAAVYIDFSKVSKETRNQIEPAVDDFLDLVTRILEEQNN